MRLLPSLLSVTWLVVACQGGPGTGPADGTRGGRAGGSAIAGLAPVQGRLAVEAGIRLGEGVKLISNGGASLIGDAGGALNKGVLPDRAYVLARPYTLLGVETALVSGARVYLADATGKPVPGLEPVRTDDRGTYRFPTVRVKATYVVVAEVPTDRKGGLATYRTLARVRQGGARAPIDPATTLVTSGVLDGLSQSTLGAFFQEGFGWAAEETARTLRPDTLPDFADTGAVREHIAALANANPMLREELDQLRENLRDEEAGEFGPEPSPLAPEAEVAPSVRPSPRPRPSRPPASRAPKATPRPGATSRPTATPRPSGTPTPTARPVVQPAPPTPGPPGELRDASWNGGKPQRAQGFVAGGDGRIFVTGEATLFQRAGDAWAPIAGQSPTGQALGAMMPSSTHELYYADRSALRVFPKPGYAYQELEGLAVYAGSPTIRGVTNGAGPTARFGTIRALAFGGQGMMVLEGDPAGPTDKLRIRLIYGSNVDGKPETVSTVREFAAGDTLAGPHLLMSYPDELLFRYSAASRRWSAYDPRANQDRPFVSATPLAIDAIAVSNWLGGGAYRVVVSAGDRLYEKLNPGNVGTGLTEATSGFVPIAPQGAEPFTRLKHLDFTNSGHLWGLEEGGTAAAPTYRVVDLGTLP